MYLHVPAAWLAYLAFAVVFVASVAYLVTKRTRWDRLAAASAEIGVLFTALTIVLGSIWAKPVWGTWWTWDPRLTTTAILLLIYVGYLAVRRLSDSPARKARWAAVVGIVGFLDVPIVHLSVVWWRSLHQAPASPAGRPRAWRRSWAGPRPLGAGLHAGLRLPDGPPPARRAARGPGHGRGALPAGRTPAAVPRPAASRPTSVTTGRGHEGAPSGVAAGS